jgi:cobalt-zinc-cadmium efflux system outer membrane protein
VLPIILLATLASATPSDPPAVSRSLAPTEDELAQLVWKRSPVLVQVRQSLIEGEANRDRSHLLPNPTLTGTWATIPIGERNPPEIGFWKVPNYTAQLGTVVELGKRGPRQRAAHAGAQAAELELEDVYRQTFFAVLETMAAQAEAVARLSVLERLVADATESLRLQRARADRGDVAPLEVDRLDVEHLRLLSQVQEAAGVRDSALGQCAALLGSPCPRFADETAARTFLARAEGAAVPAAGQAQRLATERSDIRALGYRRTEAEEARTLAERHAIPDPSLTVGYTNDRFVAAGNQSQSLNLSLSIPLPVFDRGQADAKRARRVADAVSAAQATLVASAEESARLAGDRMGLLGKRAHALDQDAVPRAKAVLDRTESAARRGGVALQDVLLARRALEELQLDRVEVAAEQFRALLDLRRVAGPPPPPPGR